MSTKSLYEEEMRNPKFAKLMAEESFILEVTEKIIELMQKEGISKAELAKRLCKSKGFITQLLNGRRNFTVRTIADIFHALGYNLQIKEEKYSQWQCGDEYTLIKDNIIKLSEKKAAKYKFQGEGIPQLAYDSELVGGDPQDINYNTTESLAA